MKNQKFGLKLGVFPNYISILLKTIIVIMVVIPALVQTLKLVIHACMALNNKLTVLVQL